MIRVAYFDYYKRTGRDNFVFALTLKPEVVDEHLVSWGELITHLTGFAYKFGELARNLTNGKIDDLIAQLDEYPEIPIKRTLALGTFAAYRISRVNPSEIRIDNLNRKASHTFNGSLSTSDLIMYFSYGVNGQIVVFDDQNKKKQVNKNLKLLNETMDGFDLSEIWIDPDNPEKWLVN